MGLLDLLLPDGCAGCGRPGSDVCPGCAAGLDDGAAPAWPSPPPQGLPPPWAATTYDGSCRELLLGYKERGRLAAAAVLGRALAVALEAACAATGPGRWLLVPVPATAAAARARGEDVVRELACRAAAGVRRGGRDVRVLPALHHLRTVLDSAGLGAAERARNVSGAFGVRPAARVLLNRPIILADDLITTGTTLAEAARALRAEGATVVAAVTVAATRRHDAGITVQHRTSSEGGHAWTSW